MRPIHAVPLISSLLLGLAACSDDGPAPASEQSADTPTPAVTIQNPGRPAISTVDTNAIVAAANGDHRSPAHIARNAHRHPVATLEFLGLAPDHTVVELWPGGAGWYTEVLAPVVAERGLLVAANYPADHPSEYLSGAGQAFRDKLAADPDTYARVSVVDYLPPERNTFGFPESVDLVFIPRAYHNLIRGENVDHVLSAAFDVLKPGGVLGIVQHRANEDAVPEAEQRNGYVKESVVIADAEHHGFELAGRSEINANPQDTADHALGVWTLPPVLRACRELEGQAKVDCEAEYRAIGESDRMTLKFVKPGG